MQVRNISKYYTCFYFAFPNCLCFVGVNPVDFINLQKIYGNTDQNTKHEKNSVSSKLYCYLFVKLISGCFCGQQKS